MVEAIKKGLERDGLGDLHPQVHQDDDATGHGIRKINRRPAFASTEIYLPKVMVRDSDQVREFDYGTDVLSRIDWRDFDPGGIADRIPDNARAADTQLRRVSLRDDDRDPFVDDTVARSGELLALDPVHAVRMILDIVPNPFLGRRIVGRLLKRLRERGFDDAKLGGIARLVVEELRMGLDRERNARAEGASQANRRGRGHPVLPASGRPKLANAGRGRYDRSTRRPPACERGRWSPSEESVRARVRERVQPRGTRGRRVSRRRGNADVVAPQRSELVANDGVTVQCALILMSEWKTKLPPFLTGHAS